VIVKDYFVETEQLKEISSPGSEHKNIRRRVYDALNVLMAMDVITKDKKDISWQGLPKGAAGNKQNMSDRSRALIELERMEREKEKHVKDVKKKRLYLQQLLQQQVCYRNLVRHNEQHEVAEERRKALAQSQSQSQTQSTLKRKAAGPDSKGSGGGSAEGPSAKKIKTTLKKEESNNQSQSQERIALPFIVINTSNQTMVGCKFGPDRTEASFNFSKPFEINDDNEILKMLGFNKATTADLKEFLPNDLYDFCERQNVLAPVLKETSPAPVVVGSNGGNVK